MSVLVSIRYPLAEQSIRTLEYAAELARGCDTDVIVLHVDLFQSSRTTQRDEMWRAIRPLLDGSTFSVITRHGFLLEEVILEEASQTDVEHIVIGQKQTPKWRQLLGKLVGNSPDITEFLRERTTSEVHAVGPSRSYDSDRPVPSPATHR